MAKRNVWTQQDEEELRALEEAERAEPRSISAGDDELSRLQAEEEKYQQDRKGTVSDLAEKAGRVATDFAGKITSPSYLATMGMLKSDTADKAVFKALNYGSGLFGTMLTDAISKNPEAVTSKDYLDALAANPTKPSVLLERDGVAPGKNLSDTLPFLYSETGEGMPLKKGGDFDPNWRDFKGFAISTVADPLNYLGLGAGMLKKLGIGAKVAKDGARIAKGVSLSTAADDAMRLGPKLSSPQVKILDDAARAASGDAANTAIRNMQGAQEVLSPVGKAIKGVGRAWYRRPFKGVEAKTGAKFKTKDMKRLTDVLFENNIFGDAESVARQTDDLTKNLGTARRELFGQIKEPINLNDGTIYRNFKQGAVRDWRNPIRQDGVVDAMGDLKKITRRLPGGKADAELASEMSSDLSKISRSAYDRRPGVYEASKEARKRIAKDIKEEIIRKAEQARPGMGKEIRQINRNFEPILKSRKYLDAMATRDASRKAFSQIDGALLGAAAPAYVAGQMLKNPWLGSIPLTMFGLKKGTQMAGSTLGATLGGVALKKLGSTSLWDNILRNLYLNEKLDGQE